MGPLQGLRVVEFAGIGPAPFCAMLLADLGADVVRIERISAANLLGVEYDVLNRGKRSVAVDLKSDDGLATALELVEAADVLIEGFRPGVMERLGLAPDVCWQRNAALVYGRMTGWGQTGPLAQAAGHDINYIALSGALSVCGEPGAKPAMPANLLGDFGGGALYLAFGVMAAVYEARSSGKGQVVDAAISDCSAHLSTMLYGLMHNGLWQDERGKNLLDGGAAHYNSYCCADGKWVSIGPLEPQFYAEFLSRMELADDPGFDCASDPAQWPTQRERLAAIFVTKKQQAWCELLEGSDCCFAPVLGLREATEHPHNRDRQVFETHDGCVQPGPSPRFSRTPGKISGSPPTPGQHSAEVLRDWKRARSGESR